MAKRSASLYAASLEQPDPPCIEYDCPALRLCQDHQLACQAFHEYVVNAKVITPYSRIIIKRTGSVSKKTVEFTDSVTASRKQYKKVFRDG